jgi:5-methylcytosine-specific restriction endonuclease McrA
MRSVLLTVGYEPLGIISWFKAINLYFEEKVEVVWTYPDQKLHSFTQQFDWPSILTLKYDVRVRPEKVISPSTRAILVRDLYTCQYCGCKLNSTTGTKDHVIPSSKGGKTVWTNLVAACRHCQLKKGDRFPDECGMIPISRPKAPTLVERFKNNIQVASGYERKNWRIGFKKLGLDHLFQL